MADYAITAASVRPSATATIRDGTASETITAGAVLYQTTTSNWYGLARANGATTDNAAGIALNGASSGQPIKFCTKDADFTHGLTSAAAGDILVLSAGAAGKIAPAADMASTNYVSLVGVCTSATKAKINLDGSINCSEVAKA